MNSTAGVGVLLREWREDRRLSQLAVSAATGVSTRHLSCVETGRAKPSRDLVLHLARELDVSLRDQNQLLLAAGFAPTYSEHALDDPAMAPVLEVLADVLTQSEPNPAVIVDRHWNLVRANAAAFWLCHDVAPELLQPPANIALLSLHPDGLAPHIENLDEYAQHVIHRLARTAAASRDQQLSDLVEDLRRLAPSSGGPRPNGADVSFAVPMRLTVDGQTLALFSTIATFGTAVDITLAEVAIETFYPADAATRNHLATRPWS